MRIPESCASKLDTTVAAESLFLALGFFPWTNVALHSLQIGTKRSQEAFCEVKQQMAHIVGLFFLPRFSFAGLLKFA